MKLKILRGLPGSGKSTRAREIGKESGVAGRINRDDLRAMLFDGIWSGQREKIVIEIEKAIAQVLIKNKFTPIIDDTNLSQSHKDMWQSFCHDNNVTCEMETMPTSLADCIKRDNLRAKSIGEAIINKMALDNGMIDFGEKPIVIVDIDGVISDGTKREHFIALKDGRPKKDWDSYFREMVIDEPITHVINWVNELAKEYQICLVSARPDTYQLETLWWLRSVAHVHFDYIFLRKGSDKRPDIQVKSEVLEKLPKSQIFMILEDRPRLVKMYKEKGFFCIPIAGACEEF